MNSTSIWIDCPNEATSLGRSAVHSHMLLHYRGKESKRRFVSSMSEKQMHSTVSIAQKQSIEPVL